MILTENYSYFNIRKYKYFTKYGVNNFSCNNGAVFSYNNNLTSTGSYISTTLNPPIKSNTDYRIAIDGMKYSDTINNSESTFTPDSFLNGTAIYNFHQYTGGSNLYIDTASGQTISSIKIEERIFVSAATISAITSDGTPMPTLTNGQFVISVPTEYRTSIGIYDTNDLLVRTLVSVKSIRLPLLQSSGTAC